MSEDNRLLIATGMCLHVAATAATTIGTRDDEGGRGYEAGKQAISLLKREMTVLSSSSF